MGMSCEVNVKSFLPLGGDKRDFLVNFLSPNNRLDQTERWIILPLC